MTRKFLITTDVRFWRRQTGAEQRIYAMADFLRANGFEINVCFTSGLEAISSAEAHQIADLDCKVTSLVDDWQPDGLWQKMAWQAKCIAHAVFPASQHSPLPPNRPFAEFESNETRRRFYQFLKHEQPDIVLIEYATLAYLVPPKHERGSTKFVIDTHDILWKRNEAFQQNGFQHWVHISAAQETAALLRFDLILAIQTEEAELLSQMVEDQVPVVVAGHPIQAQANPPGDEKLSEDRTTFGMLASANAANVQSLNWFFDNVWKPFKELENVEFILAGSIADKIPSSDLPNNVRLLGRVEKLSDFYDHVDVVINPVQFGTGLKIKTVEAIAHSKPLLTTSHGLSGIQATESNFPCVCGDTAEEWMESMQKLAQGSDMRRMLSERATSYAQSNLDPRKVYADLLTSLSQL